MKIIALLTLTITLLMCGCATTPPPAAGDWNLPPFPNPYLLDDNGLTNTNNAVV
jgi:hypothetical protein